LLVDDILFLLAQFCNLLFTQFVSSFRSFFNDALLLDDEVLNLFTDQLFNINGVVKRFDLVSEFGLIHCLKALNAGKLAFNLTYLVLDLELPFSLGLVAPLLLGSNFIAAFLSLLSKIILLFLEVLVNLFNFVVKLLLSVSEVLVLILVLDVLVNLPLEAGVRLVLCHFVHQVVHLVAKI